MRERVSALQLDIYSPATLSRQSCVLTHSNVQRMNVITDKHHVPVTVDHITADVAAGGSSWMRNGTGASRPRRDPVEGGQTLCDL